MSELETRRANLRSRIEVGETLWCAGAHDALSAKIIADSGFEGVFTTGHGISAALLGQPDIETYTMTENLAVVSRIAEAVPGIPVIVDCDSGYGSVTNIQRSVRCFEKAGAFALVLEDQVSPKRCPCLKPKPDIMEPGEAAARIQAACDARLDSNTLIVARTDATELDDCIDRAVAYSRAGADLIQPVSGCVASFDDLTALRRAAGKPLSLQILGWLEASLTVNEIHDVAGIATFPLVAIHTAVHAMQENLSALSKSRTTTSLPHPRVSIDELAEIVGFSEIAKYQEKYILLEKRYSETIVTGKQS